MDILGATSNLVGSAASAASKLADSGPASGLSGITGAVGNFFSSLGGGGKVKLPIANTLSSYASYDYVISISPMTFKDVNFPDSTYKAGKKMPLICKSANADPSNRIQTAYGKYDFFIDNLKFDTIIGPHNPKSTNVTTIQFDVVEPYSLGVFLLAIQTAAYKAGFKNWRDAPFLLTIEFRGMKEDGKPVLIPGCTRHIPFKFTTVLFKANEQGSQYNINAYATQNMALTVEHSNLKSDTTIKGKTVQEVLQTGPQSLQAVVNKKLQELVKDKSKAVADQVLIMFPQDVSSANSPNAQNAPQNSTATVNPKAESDASSIFTKLGVVQSSVNQTYIQPDGQVNLLGAASMGYSLDKKGDSTTAEETATYDDKTGIWTRGKITTNINEGSLRFAQDCDIPTVINQVLLMSDYPTTGLDSNNTDSDGMKTWWRIDTQVYYIESEENLDKTGTYPKIIVYRILPYKAHASKLTSPNQPAEGFKAIEKKIVKSYEYIYTGKNTEVLKFDIDFSINFSNVLAADSFKKNNDVVNAKSQAGVIDKPSEVDQLPVGNKPDNKAGATTSQVKYTGTSTSFDRRGGGGSDDAINRAARVWHDAITNPNDMININLDIYGDPFWIANSGQGNYTSKPSGVSKDLNVDGTVNWQTSEVDIMIKFRSPFDIKQDTGLYNFGSNSQTAPVMGFTGLYCINRVTNQFRGGQFRQTLKGFRRPLQESKATPKKDTGVTSNIPPSN